MADTLITRGMELSADDPTMLDMRNAILQADLVAYDGSHTRAIWQIFANRGMGLFAGSIDGGDTTPAEDFHVRRRLSDAARRHHHRHRHRPDDRRPGRGRRGPVAGQGDQYTATTGADGFYEIGNLVVRDVRQGRGAGAGLLGDVQSGNGGLGRRLHGRPT